MKFLSSIKITILSLLFISNFNAYATAPGYTGMQNILEVDTLDDQRIMVTLEAIDPSLNCTSNKVKVVTADDDNRDQIFSILLAAYITRKPVNLYVNSDTAGNCDSDRVRIY